MKIKTSLNPVNNNQMAPDSFFNTIIGTFVDKRNNKGRLKKEAGSFLYTQKVQTENIFVRLQF